MDVSPETRAVWALRNERHEVLFGIHAALVVRWRQELETFAGFEAFRAAYGEPT